LWDKNLQTHAATALTREDWQKEDSLLISRPVAFQRDILDVMRAQCEYTTEIEEFRDCVRRQGTNIVKRITPRKESAYISRSRNKEHLLSSFGRKVDKIVRKVGGAAPMIEVVSTVEERPFQVDRDLNFLRPMAGQGLASQLWPFEFVLNAKFGNVGLGGKTKGKDGRVIAPWISPSLSAQQVTQAVAVGVAKNTHQRQVIVELRDFTILQRLFRVALNGDLGMGFPVEKLINLAHELSGDAVQYEATDRWVN